MENIVCKNCGHKHRDIYHSRKSCKICKKPLDHIFTKTVESLKKNKHDIGALTLELSDYHATKNSVCRATFLLTALAKDYKEVELTFFCEELLLNKTDRCNLMNKDFHHLSFTPKLGGLYTLRITVSCITADNSIDKFEAEADLPVDSPVENVHYKFNTKYKSDTSINRGNVKQFIQVDGVNSQNSPSKRQFETQSITLQKISHIPYTAISSARLSFKSGGIFQQYWISAKGSVTFGRPNPTNANTTVSENADFPLNLFENTSMEKRISSEHFKISSKDNSFVFENLSTQGTYVNDLLSSLDNPKEVELTLSCNDIIKMCNATQLELKVEKLDADSGLFIKYLNDYSEERAFIIFSEKLDLSPYLEEGSPNIELIHKNERFYTKHKNTEKPLVLGEYVKFDNVEFCLESVNQK